MKEGFFKVAQSGSSFVVATFFNPVTNEEFSKCVRDYDYEDGSRDDDELYYMPIDEEARRAWLHTKNIFSPGDTVFVFKGRKLPVGTVGTVKDRRPYRDRYGRTVAYYLYFEDGTRTNESNCILVSPV